MARSVAALLVSAAVASAQPFRAAGPGRIDFPNSGAAKAQPSFIRGVVALHSFEYEEALDAFREAQRLDPAFAMAHWGETMSHNRTLWAHEDLAGGRSALSRLGATPAARSARAPTARERGYLEAVEILFGDGDKPSRDRRYADAMGRLAARFPDDHEASTFHALALLATAQRGIQGIAAEGPHRHVLAGTDFQQKVAAILRKVLAANPEHPGAAHYLIHVWDDPDHAAEALPVARTYARIAPEASHARHMPAHVFFQLGLWHEAARSDEAAWAASDSFVRRRKLPLSLRSYHSLSWLQYVYLQEGRLRAAEHAIGEIEPVARSAADSGLLGIAASMRARFVVESGRWDLVRGRRQFDNHDELYAIGLGAARTGDMETANMVRQELARRAEAERTGDYRPIVAILERQIDALIQLRAGDAPAAVARLREAVDREARIPVVSGPPPVIKPSQELFGEALLQLGRPREAVVQFEGALRRYRNRSASILGLARAEAAAGARRRAAAQYGAFLANWRNADKDRPELAEARKGAGASSS